MDPVKMKSNDPEYFKMYQRELYKTKLCVKINCQCCGAIITVKSLKRHSETPKCMKHSSVPRAFDLKEAGERLMKAMMEQGWDVEGFERYFSDERRG
jgi:hypothetical protein